MYTKEIILTGKHAFFVKELVNNYKLFPRYIDVYLVAPLVGYIHGNREEKDDNSPHVNDTASIFLEQINRERERLKTNYRLIMLLNNDGVTSTEEQIERAFKDDSNETKIERHHQNKKIFESYVRAGISTLFEVLVENGTEQDDYIKNAYDYIKDFQREISDDLESRVEEELKSY